MKLPEDHPEVQRQRARDLRYALNRRGNPAPVLVTDASPKRTGEEVLNVAAHITRLQAEATIQYAKRVAAVEELEAVTADRDALKAEVERLRSEQKTLTDANHRQAMCIHATAQALGPDVAATVSALPKAAKHLQSELTKARELLEVVVTTKWLPADFYSRVKAVLAHQSAPAAKGEPK